VIAELLVYCTGGKLASLEEFQVQRQELLNETAQLEATLQEQEKIHQSEIYDLEKKQVIDKDRYSYSTDSKLLIKNNFNKLINVIKQY